VSRCCVVVILLSSAFLTRLESAIPICLPLNLQSPFPSLQSILALLVFSRDCYPALSVSINLAVKVFGPHSVAPRPNEASSTTPQCGAVLQLLDGSVSMNSLFSYCCKDCCSPLSTLFVLTPKTPQVFSQAPLLRSFPCLPCLRTAYTVALTSLQVWCPGSFNRADL
jgi:hypothetical protein